MHIGIDVRLTHYRTGGISTYMRQLVQALALLDRDNRYTILKSRKARESITTRFGERGLWTPCHHRLERWTLSAELLWQGLDVLHSPDFIPPLRGARRHVITVHDLTFLHYPQFLTTESRRYYNGQIERAVRQADHILADSQATRDDLTRMLGVDTGKITVHWPGVDDRFRPLPEEQMTAAARALEVERGYLLFVGTIEPRKNIGGLLRAYRALVDSLPDAPPLVLVGRPGWLYEDSIAMIGTLGLAERVIWRKDIRDEDLPAVYSLASALILPSFYEGFGFPALEAMACGTVPLVSNRSSLPEVVGNVGAQFDPEATEEMTQAMQRALADTAWREQMQVAGIARAAGFTWRATAETALATYQKVAAT